MDSQHPILLSVGLQGGLCNLAVFIGCPHYSHQCSYLTTSGQRLKPAGIVGTMVTFLKCFMRCGDARKPRSVFATCAFSKLLLLVLSVDVLAKVRVIVLGKCHQADKAALVSL